MRVSESLCYITFFFSFAKEFICYANALPHVSSDESNKTLYATTNNTIPSNESLYPTPSPIELINPSPTLLYPDKLPKFIKQKDDEHKSKKKSKKKRNKKKRSKKKRSKKKNKNN